jgi:hypothetical protein
MKNKLLKQMAVITLTVTSLTACQKQIDVNADRDVSQQSRNPVRRAFKAETLTYYRFSPVLDANFQPTIIPVNVGGTDYWGMSHVPGSGTGSATHMGEVRTYFNQLAYWPVGTTDPTTTPTSGSMGAPVRDVAGYPLILPFPGGQPFPTAQDLAFLNTVPRIVDGLGINSVFVNAKGEAVYTAYDGNSTIIPQSPTRIVFTGKGKILGGTGKFANATGEFTYLGYFNPQNQDDAGYNTDGWILY